MPETALSDSAKPRAVSLCGTWLKPEMQSIYRQVTGLQRHQSVVFTERVQYAHQFPWEPVVTMKKIPRPRARGNFLLHFWYKRVVKKWPPPRPIHKLPSEPWFPYDLPQLLRRWQPRVVHAYYGHKAVKYLSMLNAWGGPWLASFHGVDVVKFTDNAAHLADLRRVFADARLVLARSDSLLRGLEALGCPSDKLRLNRTPIPVERFPFEPRAAPAGGAWRLLQACRLIPKKGLFTMLEALRPVVARWPRVKFVLCGSGPEKARFLAARDTLGLAPNVQLCGWLDQPRLLDEYRRAHVFLHPSELTDASDQEGIPNSMLEAMATGLPVIATQHGGIPEAVNHGADGWLVPERSPRELADAILSLLENPDLYAAMSRHAAASVRENFSLENSIRRLEDCYDEAAASPAQNRGAVVP